MERDRGTRTGHNASVTAPTETTEPSSVSVTGSVVATAFFLGLAALAGPTTTALAIAVTIGVIAWGWAGALGLPTPRGTVGVLLLGGLAIVSAVTLSEGDGHLNWLPGALAVCIITAFLHQLLRRDGRPRVAESVSAVLLALTLFTCAAFLVPLSRSDLGAALALASVCGAAASALVSLAMRKGGSRVAPWVVPMGLAVGGGGGALISLAVAAPWSALMVCGVLAAGVSHGVRTVFAPLPTMAHARPRMVVALCSVVIVGIIPYAVALVLLPGALSR